jgi:hypothetical protein
VGRSCSNAERVEVELAKTLVGRATKTGPIATLGQALTRKGFDPARGSCLKAGKGWVHGVEGVKGRTVGFKANLGRGAELVKSCVGWAPKTVPNSNRRTALADEGGGEKGWASGFRSKGTEPEKGLASGFKPKGTGSEASLKDSAQERGIGGAKRGLFGAGGNK